MFDVAFVVLLLAASAGQAQTIARQPMGEPLAHFVGQWQGAVEGEPGRGTSERSYEYTLGGKYVLVKNRSVYPPQEKNPKGETHEDVGYFSYDTQRRRLVLRQFHVEGFVNQYVQEPPAPLPVPDAANPPLRLVFVSEAIENIPAGWRAKETYLFDGPDAFTETFELAEPGKAFAVYAKTRFTRK
jgi:hypothetical protein